MADTTLNDVISALREGNGNEQTQALLERVAASNASIVARLTKSEAETQRRYQEEKSARENAEKDAENARNEAALAAKNEKKKAGGGSGGVGGFFKDQKESVSKMGGGDFGLGLAIGAMRLSGIGVGLAGLAGLTLDDKTITDIGENASKAKRVLTNLSEDVNEFLGSMNIELPPMSDVAKQGGKKISNSLDAILAAQEGDMETFLDGAGDLAQTTSVIGITMSKYAKESKGLVAGTTKLVEGANKAVRGTVNYTGGVAVRAAGIPLKGVGNIVATGTGMAADKIAGTGAPRVRGANQDKLIKGLSQTQLDDLKVQGFSVDSNGKMRNRQGRFVSRDKADELLKYVGSKTSGQRVTKTVGDVTKTVGDTASRVKGMVPGPAMSGLKWLKGLAGKVPIVSKLLAAGSLYSILTDPETSQEEKFNATVKMLSGLGGASLGAMAGAAVGTFIGGPLGTFVGGLSGGAIGSLLGEEAAPMIAQALLGLPIKPPASLMKAYEYAKDPMSAVDDLGNAVSNFFTPDPATPRVAGRMGRAKQIRAANQTMGEDIASGQAQYVAASGGASSTPMIVSSPQTTNNIGGANAMVTGGLSSGDPIPSGTS